MRGGRSRPIQSLVHDSTSCVPLALLKHCLPTTPYTSSIYITVYDDGERPEWVRNSIAEVHPWPVLVPSPIHLHTLCPPLTPSLLSSIISLSLSLCWALGDAWEDLNNRANGTGGVRMEKVEQQDPRSRRRETVGQQAVALHWRNIRQNELLVFLFPDISRITSFLSWTQRSCPNCGFTQV